MFDPPRHAPCRGCATDSAALDCPCLVRFPSPPWRGAKVKGNCRSADRMTCSTAFQAVAITGWKPVLRDTVLDKGSSPDGTSLRSRVSDHHAAPPLRAQGSKSGGNGQVSGDQRSAGPASQAAAQRVGANRVPCGGICCVNSTGEQRYRRGQRPSRRRGKRRAVRSQRQQLELEPAPLSARKMPAE